jgi:hypothetical protein
MGLPNTVYGQPQMFSSTMAGSQFLSLPLQGQCQAGFEKYKNRSFMV